MLCDQSGFRLDIAERLGFAVRNKDVMAIMASKKWDLESIITREFPLKEISKAIQTAADPWRAFNVTIRF